MINKIQEHAQNLRQNQGFQKYLFNTLWMFADQALRLMAGLAVGVWVARYLGPEQFGVFNYAIAFIAIFGVISKLGMDTIMVRNLVSTPDEGEILLGTAFWLKTLGACATLVMVAGYISFSTEPGNTKGYLLILAAGLFFQAFEVIDFYFQAKVLSKFVSICKTTQLLISSLVKVYLVITRASLDMFVAVQLLDQVTLSVTQVLAFRYHTGNLRFLRRFDGSIARSLLHDSWPLIVGSLFVVLYMKADQLMIMHMLGEHELGLFSTAARISEVWHFVPTVIASSLLPAILGAKKTSEIQYRARLQTLFNFLVLISLTVAITMTFIAPQVITLLFGEAYRDASPVLSVHIWTGIFASLGLASTGWFLGENLQRFAMVKAVAALVLSITMNSILIPRYGVLGAASATVVCQLAASVLFNGLYSRSVDLFKMQAKSLVNFWNISLR